MKRTKKVICPICPSEKSKQYISELNSVSRTNFENAVCQNPQISVKYRMLALDPATHCGWAISNDVYGVWNLTPKRDESMGMRLIRFRAKLIEIIENEKINLVSFERPGGRHTGAIIVQSELQGQIKVICEERFIPYRAYSSQEIKKHATGKGNSGKPQMVSAAKQKLGYTGKDDNEADALWLLDLTKLDYQIK